MQGQESPSVGKIVRSSASHEIPRRIEGVAEKFEAINDTVGCFVHSFDGHRRAFYKKLHEKFGANYILTGYQANATLNFFLRATNGSPAVFIVSRGGQIKSLCSALSVQASCALYIFDLRFRAELEYRVGQKFSSFYEAFIADPMHCSYFFSEDASIGDAIPEEIDLGPQCPLALREALLQN